MFEKLKNIKFSWKKKGKNKGDTPAEDVFSSSDDDNFFGEPSFAEDDGSTDDLFGETGAEDDSATDIAADIPEDKRFDKKAPSSSANGKSTTRRTFLLFVLLLIFSAYAAYTYILPDNYPELKKDIDSKIEELNIPKYSSDLMQMIGPKVEEFISQVGPKAKELISKVSQLISGEDSSKEVKPPKRIAIQKPPKKAMPKPATEAKKQKPKEEKPKAKKAPAKKEVKAAIPAKTQEAVKKVVKKPPVKVKPKPTPASPKPVAKLKPKKEPTPIVKPRPSVRKKPLKKKVKVIRAHLPVSEKGYYIQAGAFIFKDNLNAPKKKIESLGFRPKVKTGPTFIGMHRLLVGAWDDFLIAEDIAAKLRRLGFKAELTSKNERFCVLIGSYYYKNKADRKRKALKAKGFNSRIEKKRIKMKINYLLLGPYATSGKAAEITEVLDTKGLKTAIIQTK